MKRVGSHSYHPQTDSSAFRHQAAGGLAIVLYVLSMPANIRSFLACKHPPVRRMHKFKIRPLLRASSSSLRRVFYIPILTNHTGRIPSGRK